MFGLFKAKQNRELDQLVFEVGTALHKQVKMAADSADSTTRTAIFGRMDAAFTAGYLYGYVQSALAEQDLGEQVMDECKRKVFDGIFPGRGYDFVEGFIDRLNNADDMGLNIRIEQLATDFGLGLEVGENDTRVNSGGLSVARGLSTYLVSGRIRDLE